MIKNSYYSQDIRIVRNFTIKRQCIPGTLWLQTRWIWKLFKCSKLHHLLKTQAISNGLEFFFTNSIYKSSKFYIYSEERKKFNHNKFCCFFAKFTNVCFKNTIQPKIIIYFICKIPKCIDSICSLSNRSIRYTRRLRWPWMYVLPYLYTYYICVLALKRDNLKCKFIRIKLHLSYQIPY